MQIEIASNTYEIEDILSNITIVDSAVVGKHKIGTAHGERKIYLCGNVNERLSFFNNFSTEIKGFVWKQNLLEYLEMAKKEYKNPQHEYKEKSIMPKEYEELKKMIQAKEEILEFKVKKADVTHSGIYINQDSGKKTDLNWNLIGQIALPRISRLSIIKVSDNGNLQYYFKISFGVSEVSEKEDENELKKIEQKIENSRLSQSEKETLILARVGQGTYRKKLLEVMNICPFTMVDDEHLLIASHIKPWKKSNNIEKKDPRNGFVFTPTYDKLFDRGYISFTDNKELMLSPWLSRYNCDRLGLTDGMLVEKLPVIDDRRKVYLEYHRAHILKKLEDL